jgi:hypothetical protein
MMYAYKIDIKYEPQPVRYHREVTLPSGLLKLDDIGKHLKEGEVFGIRELRDNSMWDEGNIMDIFGNRLETQKEIKERVAKEEAYNIKYEEHKLKYGK